MAIIKTISIPRGQRKRTTLGNNLYYDQIEIHDNRVVGFFDGQQTMTWYFKDFNGIDVVRASINSQFGQIIFLTGINSKNRAVGIDLGMMQNLNAMNDTNRILFCSGMFSFSKTNNFVAIVASDIRSAYDDYRNKNNESETVQVLSVADEIKKFKKLLDDGVISQEEFDAKKEQLLSL